MEFSGGAVNWSEAAEDLVHGGDIDGAVNLLETKVSNLEIQLQKKHGKENFRIVDELSTALRDLSKVYSAGGFSLKADQALSRALQIKHHKGDLSSAKELTHEEHTENSIPQNMRSHPDGVTLHDNDGNGLQHQEISEDDDWEAAADCAPEELLSVESLQDVSKLSLENSETKTTTKRRGRGTFLYETHSLYSDSQVKEEPIFHDSENIGTGSAEDSDNKIKCLEPPRERPQTSARTAQRLIAHGMGIKLPSTLGSTNEEFKRQEEARRNRIVSRQNMRDDAWGGD